MPSRSSAATDIGLRRDHNEDAFSVDEDLELFVVADGMGGHASGEVASALAVQSFRDYVRERSELVWGLRDASPSITPGMVRRLLEDALHVACREVYRKAAEDPSMRGMGTTLVALVLAGDRAFVAHVGDSRAYLVRGPSCVQLTRDHSVLNELIRSGDIHKESVAAAFAPFRNALSRAVGVCEDVEVESMDVEVLPDDVLLLASDGVTQYLLPGELEQLACAEPAEMTAALVSLAKDRGGCDNITAIAVRVETDPLDPGGARQRTEEFERKMAAFRSLPMCRHLDYGELIRALSITDVMVARRGEVVLREGQAGDALYVVLSGRVVLDRGGAPIAEFEAGAHFGEVSLLDHAPRSATATVAEDARLLRLRREPLYALVQREPTIAVKLLSSFAATLGDRVRTGTNELVDLRAVMDAAMLGKGTPETNASTAFSLRNGRSDD